MPDFSPSLAERQGFKNASSLVRSQSARPGLKKDSSLVRPQDERPGIEKKFGHSMTEYALPAVLVGLVVVGSMVALLNNGDFAQTGAQTLFHSDGSTRLSDGALQLQTKQLGKNPLLNSFSFTTEKGNAITIPNFPTELSALVEVDGGFGTIDKLLGALDAYIQALLEAGEITQDQANAMKRLSSAGFVMADGVKDHETYAAHCGLDKRCMQLRYTEAPAGTPDVAYQNNLANVIGSAESVYGPAGGEWLTRSGQTPVTDRELAALNRLLPQMIQEQAAHEYTNYNARNLTLGRDLKVFVNAYADIPPGSLSPKVSQVLNFLTSSILVTANSGTSAALNTAVSQNWQETHHQLESQQFASVTPDQWVNQMAENVGFREKEMKSHLMGVQSGRICDLAQGTVQPGSGSAGTGSQECR